MRHQAQYRAKESFQTEVIWKESADGRNAVRFFDAKAKKEVPPLQECTSLCSCVTVRKRSAYLLSESLSSFFSSSASAVICAGWSASSSSSSASTAPANEQNPPSHPPASGALSSLSDSSGFGASVSVFSQQQSLSSSSAGIGSPVQMVTSPPSMGSSLAFCFFSCAFFSATMVAADAAAALP